MPRGTTATFLWFAALAVATALSPWAELRLVPTPGEAIAWLQDVPAPHPTAPAPAPELAFVATATAAPEPLGPRTPLGELPPLEELPNAAEDPKVARDVARAYAIGSREIAVEEPCLEPVDPSLAGCRRGALDAFQEALLRARGGRGTARIVHFGDSTISSDLVASTARERLQARFGDGGRGFLFVDGPTRYHGQLRRAGKATPGWEITSLAGPFSDDGRYGMAGASFAAPHGGEAVSFAPRGSEIFDLHYTAQPGGGELLIQADGAPLATISTEGAAVGVQFARLKLPAGCKQVSVKAQGPARLHGAVLERDAPGVVWDTIGVPGASAETLLLMDEGDLTASLRRRRPDLVAVMLGMNESHTLQPTPEALAAYEARERSMLAKLRRAAPFASCLVISPMDGGKRLTSGAVQSRPVLPLLRDVQRRAAHEAGCGFWDMFEAMGGAGSVGRWLDAGFAYPDLAHPSNDGGSVLGFLLADALLASHRRFVARAPATIVDQPPGIAPGIVEPLHLQPFFAALARVDEKQPAADARVVVLGDSHVAADKWPSQLRRRLAGAFGSAGRGLFFPGAPWRTGAPDDVTLRVSGFHTQNALGVGGPYGAGGLRTQGALATDAILALPAVGPVGAATSAEIQWRVDPAGGVLFAGAPGAESQAIDTRTAGDAPPGSPLGWTTLPVLDGGLELHPAGDAPVTLLGLALRSDAPGTTVEALGLSGATAAELVALDPELFVAQLARLRPALVVVAVGANEAQAAFFDAAIFRDDFTKLVRRARAGARGGSCLVIGPPDTWRERGGALQPSEHLPWIAGLQREIAAREGCAFWDARTAMGGEGAMAAFVKRGLGHEDHVHLRAPGYRRLGDLLFEDLLAARPGAPPTGSAPP